MIDSRDYLTFTNRDEWRSWLKSNHDRATEAWLVLYKKGTRQPSLSIAEAQEEALCFGWIDHMSKSLDASRYLLRFTPRRAGSIWSITNIRRVERLIEAGLMTEAGLEKIAEAQQNGQWEAAIASKLALAGSCLELTKSLLQKYMFRLAGSTECQHVAQEIAAILEKSCDEVALESFKLHPKALWYVGKVIAITYVLAVLGWIIGGRYLYVASLLCLIGIVYGLVQYVFYGRLFDWLFRSSEGYNVSGYLEPAGSVKQQVVVVGHHDSPYIFSFLAQFQRLAFIPLLMGIVAYLIVSASTFIASFHQISSGHNTGLHGLPLWLASAGAAFALPLFCMMSKKRSPGAGDNLNGTSIAITLSRYFHGRKQKGSSLEQTRLLFLQTGRR